MSQSFHTPVFLVDAHLDMAYNALRYGRDLTLPVAEIREAEQGRCPNGIATVSIPTLLEGNVGLAFGSIFLMPANFPDTDPPHPLTSYFDSQEAHHKGWAQVDYYHRLADESADVTLITDLPALRALISNWQNENKQVGIVPAIEGAAVIRQPEEVELWVERGVRMIGLAWDDTPYSAGGWRGGGELTKMGYALLEAMAQYDLILDISHMAEKATFQALEAYEGVAVASHSNAEALVGLGERHLKDSQIRALGESAGMIGVVLYNRFLKRGFTKGEAKSLVTLDDVAAHIDHICQLLGNANHVGIGSDFDGGLGAADIPSELDNCADLYKLGSKLKEKGYADDDISGILGENWLNLLRRAWA